MSVQSEITRIKNAVNRAKAVIEDKGVSVSDGAGVDDLAGLIDQIESGQQFSATINVTTQAGATVTCSWDGETLTEIATNGTCSFTLKRSGAWVVTVAYNGASITETYIIYYDGQVESFEAYFKPTASTSQTSGVSYTSGLSGLSASDVSLFAEAISNNSAITSTTSTVYIDSGSVHRKLSVGDQVTLAVNGTNYAFDIIGFNHDALTTATAYGASTATGKAGITLQMHDIFATTYPMNSSNTNSGGWGSSVMRSTTMGTMKGYLPSTWQSVIKPVNKKTSAGNESTTINTSSDSCFLLSEVEIFGTTTYSVSGEGTQYAYYKAGNSTIKNKSGSASSWWARSPSASDPSYFCSVGSSGRTSNNNASGSRGVAFGFCV